MGAYLLAVHRRFLSGSTEHIIPFKNDSKQIKTKLISTNKFLSRFSLRTLGGFTHKIYWKEFAFIIQVKYKISVLSSVLRPGYQVFSEDLPLAGFPEHRHACAAVVYCTGHVFLRVKILKVSLFYEPFYQ